MEQDTRPQPEAKLSKMQRIRKRELRKAMGAIHDQIKASIGDRLKGSNVYGLRVAISILGDMRKEIDHERQED